MGKPARTLLSSPTCMCRANPSHGPAAHGMKMKWWCVYVCGGGEQQQCPSSPQGSNGSAVPPAAVPPTHRPPPSRPLTVEMNSLASASRVLVLNLKVGLWRWVAAACEQKSATSAHMSGMQAGGWHTLASTLAGTLAGHCRAGDSPCLASTSPLGPSPHTSAWERTAAAVLPTRAQMVLGRL